MAVIRWSSVAGLVIREVFQITRLDQVLEIKDTREEALAAFRAR